MSIKKFGLRFYLDKDDDRRAFEYIQGTNESKNKAIINAINGYLDTQAENKVQSDFLERIIATIEQTLKLIVPASAANGLLSSLPQEENVENDDIVLDFLDSL